MDRLVFHDGNLAVKSFLHPDVTTVSSVIVDAARYAAFHDLDIFREGEIQVNLRTYRKDRLGDANRVRTINLYLHVGLSQEQFEATVIHELRHIGQFARGLWESESDRYRPHDDRPIEIDANAFSEMAMRNALATTKEFTQMLLSSPPESWA